MKILVHYNSPEDAAGDIVRFEPVTVHLSGGKRSNLKYLPQAFDSSEKSGASQREYRVSMNRTNSK